MRAELCCMNSTRMAGYPKISLYSTLVTGAQKILKSKLWLLNSLVTTHLLRLLQGSDKEAEFKRFPC